MNTETIKPEVEIEREESNALIVIEKINALEVFTDKGMTPVLEEIQNKVALLVPDVSTAKGRKEIASMANKIARSKTLLDDIGKTLVADWKAKAKVVDDSRKLMRDQLDALKEVTRSPLTQWEEAEKKRVEKYENGLKDLIAFQTIPHGATIQQIEDVIQKINAIEIAEDWGDLKDRASAAHNYALNNAYNRLEQRKEYDEQQIEILKLRQQQEERLAKEAEEKKNAELIERARIEAEQKAQRAIQEAEAKTKAAVEAQKRAEERAKLAEEQAVRESKLAAIRESESKARAEADAKMRAEAQAKYEADKKIKQEAEELNRENSRINRANKIEAATKTINKIISDSHESYGANIISAIISGEVPHIKFEG